ncbi:MAG: hypothetical protein RR651_05530 [Lysinibacillus sp.]
MSLFKKIMLIVTYISVTGLIFLFVANLQDEDEDTYEEGSSSIMDGYEETNDDEVIDDSSITPVSDTVTINKQEVYDFMENKFETITNYGDTYVPEVHDPMIAELAATEFGITTDEANNIYNEIAFNMYR